MSPNSPDKKRGLFKQTAPGQPPAAARKAPWPVLVVDDDPDVHAMTRVLLRDFSFQDRPFEVISAYSAAEARDILSQRPDIPVALLDVVMESASAGLDLVRHIRQDMGNQRLSIVLRTGQPGEAPERDVMLAYDINDYRAKTELTAQKLFTALVGGLRSWTHLTTIEALNASLEQRVEDRTRQLEEARHFSETLVDMLPNPLWYKGADGHVRLCNRAFRELFPEVGATMPPGLAALDSSTDAALRNGGASPMMVEANLEVGGTSQTVVVSKGLLGERGGGTIGILTDITERKRMEQQLRVLATTDPLTSALNRRAFFIAAEQEMERALRYGNALSVVMIDLDHFKRINDRYGHATGDAVLKETVETLRQGMRDLDVLGRLGGEEFAILLPETPLTGALELAERLRQAVEAQVISQSETKEEIRLTISQGVAERGWNEAAFDQMLARADTALYRAKEAGRNRVMG
ncbi:Response regulator containing a CheY-like receiver domain and a GGDEF domain [Candidatus Terasakiella magnetica]|nr:Response regulator containing a CheY-like receiver domain and a GGDEF domain [Candidatus Terasakiella magnetica]